MQKVLRTIQRDKFWTIYLSVVIVFIVLIVIWLSQLHRMLVAYEASMPEHVARAVAQSLGNGEYKTIYGKLDATMQGETEVQFSKYLSAKIANQPVDIAVAHASSPDEKAFTLSAGGSTFARLTLSATEHTDAYGNHGWALKGVSMPNAPKSEYFLTVPDESKVFVDEQLLGEDAIVERDIPMDCAGHLPASKVHVPTWTKYRVVRSFSAPKFRVLDRSGNEVETIDLGDGEYKVDLVYDEAVRKSQGKHAVEIAKAYGLFSIGRLSKDKFLGYTLPGTAVNTMITKYDERWFVKNTGYKFTNVRAEKFYAYAGNCYSCEVSYDLVLKAANGKTQTYPTTLTMYFYKSGSFKLYDLVISQ